MAVSMDGVYDTTINRRARRACLSFSAVSALSAVRVVSSAGDWTRDVRDLLTRVAVVDPLVHPADPVAYRLVLNLQEVREVGRPHVEPFVRGAEQVAQLAIGQV